MVKYVRLDDVFGALASTPRRRIIEMLRVGPQTITELSRPLEISLPAMHKHVRVLEQAELVSRQKVGREQRISLRPMALSSANRWIAYYLNYWSQPPA